MITRLFLPLFVMAIIPGGILLGVCYALWRLKTKTSLPELDFDHNHRRAPQISRSTPLTF